MNTETKNHGSCVICGAPRPSGYDTCGNSHCQEARHYLNAAANARKNSHHQRSALVRADIATQKAMEMADKRSAQKHDY